MRSLAAPVEKWPKTTSSAARPPIACLMRARIWSRVRRVAVLVGHRHGDAERHAARDDRDLVHRVRAGREHRHQRVTGLVVGRRAPVLVAHDQALARGAEQHLVLGLLEIDHRDLVGVAAGREQRRLVHQVLEVGAHEARRAAREHREIDVVGERHAARVHLQDGEPPAQVGPRHHHAAVEAARAAAAPGRARPAGWWRRSGSRPRCSRSRPSRRAAGSASARARRDRRRGRRRGGGRPRRSRR